VNNKIQAMPYFLTLIVAALIFGVLGCGGALDHPAQIRFAYQNRVAAAAAIVAVAKDYFKSQGLSVKALRFDNGPACAEALFTGSADLGTMEDATAITAVTRNPDLTIIASHATGEHRHRLMVKADSPIRQPQDLAGKVVAVKKGTSTHGGLLTYLNARGLNPASMQVKDLRPADMPEALWAGSIDAFVASEPTPSLAEMRGARQVDTLGGLGNQYPILILAKHDFLANHKKEVVRFLKALAQAEDFIHQQPEPAAAMVAKATGLTPELTLAAMRRHRFDLSLGPDIVASLEHLAKFLAEQKKIPAAPPLSQRLDAQYLRKAVGK
jgi:aliphatic sulfonates family ABC transporter substrate-binding protein